MVEVIVRMAPLLAIMMVVLLVGKAVERVMLLVVVGVVMGAGPLKQNKGERTGSPESTRPVFQYGPQ